MITLNALAFFDSPEQLLLIAAIFALLFGASKLPQLGSAMGKTIRNFKEEMREPEPGASRGKPVTASDRRCGACGAACTDAENLFCTACGARI